MFEFRGMSGSWDPEITGSFWILKISTFRKCVRSVRNGFVHAAQAKILRSGLGNHRIHWYKVEIQPCYQGKKVDNRWKYARQIFRYCLVWGKLGCRLFGFLTDHGSWDNGTSWILNSMIFRNALEFCSVSADEVKFLNVGMGLDGRFGGRRTRKILSTEKFSLVCQWFSKCSPKGSKFSQISIKKVRKFSIKQLQIFQECSSAGLCSHGR